MNTENRNKKFILSFVISIYVLCGTIVAINFIIDPHEATGSGYFKPVQHFVNQRIYKSRIIDKKHQQFTGYILGSSRMEEAEPNLIESYIPNSTFYNLSFPYGVLDDELKILNYMLDKDYPIQHLYIQLDIPKYFSQSLLPEHPKWPTLLHRLDIEQGGLKYVLQYFKTFFTRLSWEHLWYKWNMPNTSTPEIAFASTGVTYWETTKQKMKENYEQFMKDNFPPLQTTRHRGMPDELAENIEGIKNLITLCEKNNINCIVFTTPLHHQKLDTWNIDYVVSYLKALAKLTDFWHFTDYNSVTKNSHNYYDTSHYRYNVHELIAGRIFDDTNINVPHDFGTYWTKENVKEKAEKLRLQYMKHDENKRGR